MRRKPAMSITKTVKNRFRGEIVVDKENDSLPIHSKTPELSNRGINSQIPAQAVSNWASGATVSLHGQKQAFFLPHDLEHCLNQRILKIVQLSLQNRQIRSLLEGLPG